MTPTAKELFLSFWQARYSNNLKNPTPPGDAGKSFVKAIVLWVDVWKDCKLLAEQLAAVK